jgi:tetratricopeptide (TPR) repeat protein
VGLDKIKVHEAKTKRQQAAQEKYKHFLQQRDEALYRWIFFALGNQAGLSSDPSSDNRAETQQAANKALKEFADHLSRRESPAFDLDWTKDDQTAIRAGCCECLLILAELTMDEKYRSEDKTRKENAQQALAFLRGCQRLGLPRDFFERYKKQIITWVGFDPGEAVGGVIQWAVFAEEPHATWEVLIDFWQGVLCLKGNDPKEAARHLADVLSKQPNHYWAVFLLALCEQQKGQVSPVAVGAFTDCIKDRKQNWVVYLLRSFLWTDLEKDIEAREDLEKALTLCPDDSAAYVVRVNQGVMYIQAKKFDDAVACLEKAIALNPKGWQAHANLATAYVERNRVDQGIIELGRAIQLAPTVPWLYEQRAELHIRERDLEAALADLEKAAKQDQSRQKLAQFWGERGRLLRILKRFPEAVEAIRKAIQLISQTARKDPLEAKLYLALAETLLQLPRSTEQKDKERYQEVLYAVDQYVENVGKPGARPYRLRAQALAKLGQKSAAIKSLTQALAFEPNDVPSRLQSGWLYLLEADSPKFALMDFEAILHADPANREAAAGRASASMALALAGRLTEDRDHVDKAVADANKALAFLEPAGVQEVRIWVRLQAARIFARAAEFLDPPGRGALPRNQKTVKDYREKAITLLGLHCRDIPTDQLQGFRNYLRREPDFRSLRESVGFKKLFPAGAR